MLPLLFQEKGKKLTVQAVYFDLDGTLADLYAVPDWEKKLRNEDVTPYEEATPLVDMDTFNKVLCKLVEMGIHLGVVSHNAIGASKEYAKAVRKAKLEWCEKHCPLLTKEFHVVQYGTPKHWPQRLKFDTVLVDDNSEVRERYRGETIDASTQDIVLELLDFVKYM